MVLHLLKLSVNHFNLPSDKPHNGSACINKGKVDDVMNIMKHFIEEYTKLYISNVFCKTKDGIEDIGYTDN